VRSANILVSNLSAQEATKNITAKEIAKVTNFGSSREMTEEFPHFIQDVGGGATHALGEDTTQYLDPAYVFLSWAVI
jgi:hypothetical protein